LLSLPTMPACLSTFTSASKPRLYETELYFAEARTITSIPERWRTVHEPMSASRERSRLPHAIQRRSHSTQRRSDSMQRSSHGLYTRSHSTGQRCRSITKRRR
jgi:hypothetical protein